MGEGYSKHPDGGKNRWLSSISPAELKGGEEGGMKGKHDLAPVISTGDSRKGNHHHHNQSKHTWDSLGSMCGGLECGEAHNPGAIVIKKEGGGAMEGLRSTEQSTLTLATISA